MLPVNLVNTESQNTVLNSESVDPRNVTSLADTVKPIENESANTSADYSDGGGFQQNTNDEDSLFVESDIKFATVEAGVDEDGEPFIEIRNPNDDIIARFPPENLDKYLNELQPGSLLDAVV